MNTRKHLFILAIGVLGCVSFTRGEVAYVYRVNSTIQTWHQAFESCYNLAWGSKLAIFDIEDGLDAQENIKALLPNIDPSMCYYIGVHDLFYEGHYLDIQGRELRYTKWSTGQPDNLEEKQNCAAVNAELKMFDTECDRPNCFALCMEPDT
ncbi:hypothetical protein L9F63_017829 [Diploptera punctata]|uniref:C-type lectin domain-containing protein n=1 Tax=Diploptera punctata TaxID=6984 RepID=A0AAD7ZXX7_DIPPU|nr:hypothetical protein L9F63_017829 [Diploptera punctata]